MDTERKVFSSNIIRTQNNIKNNLHDILKIIPASPVSNNNTKNSECNYVPKNDKYYIPKKKNGMKVKTVRDIRNVFESDIYSYLPADLEKQKSLLMRKIRLGSSKDGKTKETAINMLKSSSPISRWAWQMLMNINPEDQKYPRQYVIWNGQYIQVNGSKGGSCKFLHKYDIGKIKDTSKSVSTLRRNNLRRKRKLLQNSLNVKFMPGPLTKKKNLDTSYQKNQFGDMELVTLPKPALDIQPSYGKPLAPVINTFLQNAFVLNSNGIISQKWADFAVSVLGKNKDGIPIQLNDNCNVAFDLDYKCLQHRILMRKDSEIVNHEKVSRIPTKLKEEDSVILSAVSNVIDKIIDSVEISLKQNVMFSEEEREAIESTTTNSSFNSNHNLKDKGKRKYGELGRLDVTVIRLPEASESFSKNTCHYAHCALGCVCDSLKYSYSLKTHCGFIECMFKCNCDFSKYKLTDSFENDCADIIPGLVNLEQKLGQTLSKEEQKFHQTVIVTDEKSILLKSRKRNWKASRKYADFYSNMHLKAVQEKKQTLRVVCTNLKFINVEPWCMVHNLYKCFCKGKFTKTSIEDELLNTCNKTYEKSKKPVENIDLSLSEMTVKSNYTEKESCQQIIQTRKRFLCDSNEWSIESDHNKYGKCARIFSYEGRKYNDEYYQNTNKKISEMEQNDKGLRKKLFSLINKDDCQEINLLHDVNTPDVTDPPSNLNDLLTKVVEQNSLETKDDKNLSSNNNLISWLESNYKLYKEQANQGLKKPSLHPPRPGSMALYPWEFILSRYRERKNHFLISKQQPFRIYMAVDSKNSLFDNCININDIALSDLDKYPVTVKNLLTNATDLNDNFCILCGLLHCWELVGSVTKVNNKSENTPKENEIGKFITLKGKSQSDSSSELNCSPVLAENIQDDLNSSDSVVSEVPEKNVEQSKWFVMTIENDFTEIRFYKKGFFVKYDSIMKAINVAKVSGKTVKLSSQNSSPNFGIYAIPSDTDNYVFIGPYEKDESLGVETIKTTQIVKTAKRTRGTWIKINKIDNLKVIDNPLLYIPSSNSNSNIVGLEGDTFFKGESSNSTDQVTNTGVLGKVIKPIRIRKTNDFYQLAPNGLLQPVPLSNKDNLKFPHKLLVKKRLVINKNISHPQAALINPASLLDQNINKEEQIRKKIISLYQKPVAEIAPQIKDSNNASSSNEGPKRKLEGSMFVLKPEEINKRSFENQLLCQKQSTPQGSTDHNIDMDIENFIESSVACIPPKDECYVISDDEDEDNTSNQDKKDATLKDVWIVCKNIDGLGWIPAKRDSVNHLSFEFPGFKYSEFYNEREAFNKITQVLSRKIYIPRHINLVWQVLETLPDSNVRKKLEAIDLSTDYVLTKKGLQHRCELMKQLRSTKNAENLEACNTCNEDKTGSDLLDKKNSLMNKLEETSETLEEERLFLWAKTMSKKSDILTSLNKASDDLRKELSDQLSSLRNDADDSE